MSSISVVYAVLIVIGGLVAGSLANAAIDRVPAGLGPLARPRCPQCNAVWSARHVIPVISWLALRGRCPACRETLSARYPLVELGNAALWLLLVGVASARGQQGLIPLLLILGTSGLALGVIDAACHRLPNALVLPLYPVTVAGLVLAGLIGGEWPVTTTALGALAWTGLIGGLWLLSGGRGMGMGDAKLAPVLGATLGWLGLASAAVGLMAAFMLGAIVSLVLLARRKAGLRAHIAFGPFLLVGALLGVILGTVPA